VVTTGGLILGIVALAVLWFAFLWLAICFILSRVSGWARLRQLYRTGPFEGPTVAFSGRVGPSKYRGVLIGGATSAGLYLNVAAPFRIGAGPVLIPWHEITVSPPSGGLISVVTFDFPRAGTGLQVQETVASKVLQWRGGAA